MRKLFYTLLLAPTLLVAQSTTENYVVKKTYTVPVSNPEDLPSVSSKEVQSQITYVDGLGRVKQTVALGAGGLFPSQNEAVYDWSLGNIGSTDFFNRNGDDSENTIVNGETPFGDTDLLWECKPDIHNGPDGGWNSDYFTVDKTQTYQYSVWVKKTGNQHGVTFHGTRNVNNLNGTANNNPYFWSGDPPQLDTWYLIVGVIHPYDYTGGDTGVSGVYDTQGNKVRDGKEYTWRSNTTNTQLRSYLFYTTNTAVRQYFWSPLFQKMDDNALPLEEIFTTTGVITNQAQAYDVVTHYSYDAYGRQAKEYLPYANVTQAGALQTNAEAATQGYYKEHFGEDFVGVALPKVNAFSEKAFDNSPLQRVTHQGAPGKDWKLGSGHEIKFDYNTNDANEVRLFKAPTSFANNTYTPSLTAGDEYYAVGTLYKTITKDENWQESDGNNRTTEEFKNKQGKVVLKRTYNQGVAHDTYYVHDDYGNLTYVLPPKVDPSDGVSATELSELCYQYVYDQRNRLVEKKIPGKEWEYIVYDKLDRPVLTQDAEQRADNQWLFTKYDVFGRVAYSGIKTQNISRTDLQESLSGTGDLYVSRVSSPTTSFSTPFYYDNSAFNTPPSNSELLTINYYDSYVHLPTGFTAPATVLGQALATNVEVLPTVQKTKVLETNQWITTVSYYDRKQRPVYTYSHNEYLAATDIVQTKLDFVGRVLQTHTTHKKTGHDDLVTVDRFSYDSQGRLVEHTQKINEQLPERIVKNHYNGLGQLESKVIGNGTQTGYGDVTTGVTINADLIEKTSSNGWNTGLRTLGSIQGNGYIEYVTPQKNKWFMVGLSTTNTNASYKTIDYAIYTAATLLRIYESGTFKGTFGTVASGDVFRVERVGNKIHYKKNGNTFYISTKLSSGRLIGDISMHTNKTKIQDLRIVDNSQGLQKVDYAHNVRGWLKNINGDADNDNDLFTFSLVYNTATNPSQRLYNGNISEAIWSTANVDSSQKKYAYSYDALNRITGATGTGNNFTGRYDLAGVTYDKNGNILSLQRKGHLNAQATSFGMMDNLSYTYDPGNKLIKVTDSGNDTYGFKDGANLAAEYIYDENGNMEKDHNKGFDNIQYNHLNLPTSVGSSSQQAAINYTYDASGAKIEKTVAGSGIGTTTTQYANGYVYQNNELQFFSVPEGYVTPNGSGTFDYIYQYVDQLGNVRLSYADTNGDYQRVFEDDFTTHMGDWIANGSTSPTPENGRLKVTVNTAWEGIKSELKGLYTKPGETYTLKINFDKGDTQAKVRAYFQELDANGNHLRYGMFDFDLQTGENTYQYTIVQGTRLRLRIDKDNTYTSSETHFYIDQVSLNKGAIEIVEEKNYFPFGMLQRGYNNIINSNGNSVAQKFGYNGKELGEDLGLNWQDYGARRYAADLGRWMSTDPLAEKYETVSPYTYVLNNPTYAVDPDGRLVIFVNGLLFGDAAAYKLDPINAIAGAVNDKYAYSPNRFGMRFWRQEPTFNGKQISYWGNVDDRIMNHYGESIENQALYMNGSHDFKSQASERFALGKKAGAALIAELQNGTIALANKETIKIVGHSQGAAYAAGMLTALADSEYASRVELGLYLSPHQPGGFSHPDGITGVQLSTRTDWVSSNAGFLGGLMQAFNGRSELKEIEGVNFMFIRPSHDGGKGGHDVETWDSILGKISDFLKKDTEEHQGKGKKGKSKSIFWGFD